MQATAMQLQPVSAPLLNHSPAAYQGHPRSNSAPADSFHFGGSGITNAETFFRTFNMLGEEKNYPRKQILVEALLKFLEEDQKRNPPQVPLFLSRTGEYRNGPNTKTGYRIYLGDPNSPCSIALRYGQDGAELYPMITFYTATNGAFSAYDSYHYFTTHELQPVPDHNLEPFVIELSRGMKVALDLEELVEAQAGNADIALCPS